MQIKPSKIQIFINGLKGKCPACGIGKIFQSFLKIAPQCSYCGEEFHHHRADDFPAYIVIVIVGHIIIPFVMFFINNDNIPGWVPYVVLSLSSIILILLLLQPVKGAVVAFQWLFNMHGFGESKKKNLK